MSDLWPKYADAALTYISPPPDLAWQKRVPRNVVILGSTGSIGQNALAVLAKHSDRFVVHGLSCATNVERLASQAAIYRPRYLAVANPSAAKRLSALLPKDYAPQIFVGSIGFAELARVPEAETVVSAQSGAAGLAATLSAALNGRVICLANKESLALAGRLIRAICAETKAAILPVDSEHNALFQCLAGRSADVASLVLTASGGPFRETPMEDLAKVTREQALAHPNWSMGKKITIDSATMMNKGLEVIEAYHLYGLPETQIEVLIHPQSIVHSMVRFCDGAILAQLAVADMQLPIAHCLTWPMRTHDVVRALDFSRVRDLTFAPLDQKRYPCFVQALRALRAGDAMCAVLNAANEVAVDLFLGGKIPFLGIGRLVAAVLDWAETAIDPVLPLGGNDLEDAASQWTARLYEIATRVRDVVDQVLPKVAKI